MPRVADHRHVIPVDPSLTPDEAWHELLLMHCRATNTGDPTWAVVRCDGSECPGVYVFPDTIPPDPIGV